MGHPDNEHRVPHEHEDGQLHDHLNLGPLTTLWERLPADIRLTLESNFLPENPMDNPMPGEEIQLSIGLAWYRDIVGHFVFHHFRWLVFISLLLFLTTMIVVLANGFHPLWLLLPVAIFLVTVAYGIYQHLEHLQWRVMKTNARFIISIPQHHAWPLVDNIELKGLPSVVDTNWSRSSFWRMFQAFTGGRDLYISLVGYQFEEDTAKVRGALVIPDVMPDDVFAMKKLIFRPGRPGKVTFPEAQPVFIVDQSSEE